MSPLSTQLPTQTPQALEQHAQKNLREQVSHWQFVIANKARLWLSKSVLILLALHATFGLYKTIVLIFVAMPELQHEYVQGVAILQEMNDLILEIGLEVVNLVITGVFLVRLKSFSEDFLHLLEVLLVIAFLLLKTPLHHWLQIQPWIQRWPEILSSYLVG
jgi:hypothetical protein